MSTSLANLPAQRRLPALWGLACLILLPAAWAQGAHSAHSAHSHQSAQGHHGDHGTSSVIQSGTPPPRTGTSARRPVVTAFGQAGDPAKVTRTLEIRMGDDMRFVPSALSVRKGETVRLRVSNRGKVLHELVIGTPQGLAQHAEQMRKQPHMAHDEPSMVHVRPGGSGDIVWQFTQAGSFQFACLIPGHFEAGMVGQLVVQ